MSNVSKRFFANTGTGVLPRGKLVPAIAMKIMDTFFSFTAEKYYYTLVCQSVRYSDWKVIFIPAVINNILRMRIRKNR